MQKLLINEIKFNFSSKQNFNQNIYVPINASMSKNKI